MTASTIHVLLRQGAPAVGLVCLLAYRRWSTSAAGLPLLYLSTMGIAIFLSNLMFTALVNDAVRVAGAVAIAAVLFWQGRELRQWIPAQAGRIFGTIGVVILPLVAGTGILILINQPAPPTLSFTSARLSEASLGIFAVIGALTRGGSPSNAGRSFRLWWIDGTVALAAVLAVRIAARGISLTP